MTLVQDDPSSALQEKKESQGLISVQSMVTCGHEDDIFEYPPIQEPSSGSSENIVPSSDVILEQVVSKLERQKSCESVGSMSEEDSHVSDESHGEDEEEDMSDEGHAAKKEAGEGNGEEGAVDGNGEEGGREGGGEEGGGGGGGCERSTSVVSDASEEGGRDSGIEAEKEADLSPMAVPDDALVEKIVTQVEFYFSDANVVKDKFLLKHIRRNKEGYVSLKLVSSFKKVKQLTKDWRVVAYALGKNSTFMQINDERSKIRRLTPLPEIDDSPVTCAVLALGIPLEKPSVETVSKLFGTVGEISFVRVLRAGGNLPPDVKSLMTKYPALGEKHCAWIEFETPEAAKTATEVMTSSSSGEEEGMKVVLIVPESQKKQEKMNQQKHSTSRKNSANINNNNNNNRRKTSSSCSSRKSSSSSTNGGGGGPNMNSSNYYYRNYYNNKPLRKDSNQDGFGGSHEGMKRPLQRRKAISLPSAQNPFLNDPNEAKRRTRPKSKSCTEVPSSSFSSSLGGSPPSSSSWVQRHLLAAAAASAASAASPVVGSRPPCGARISRVSVGSLPLSEGVIRFPKGPDGSRGFGRLRQITEVTH